MDQGLIAVIITILVILAIIITKRCTAVLFAGSIAAAVFLYGSDFLTCWVEDLEEVVADNAWLWLVIGLFGVLAVLLRISQSTQSFSKLLEKICKNQKSSMLASFLMGIFIFVDEYLSIMTVGETMKGLTDKRKVPREAFAFILNTTGAAVCVLFPISSWSAFFMSLFNETEEISSQFGSSMSAYLAVIPFLFYPIIILLITLLFCLNLFPKLGTMKKAYERVETTGMVYPESSRKYNYQTVKTETSGGSISDFLVPMAILAAVCVITGEVLDGLIVALILGALFYIVRKHADSGQIAEACVSGFSEMLSIMFLLAGCLLLQHITTEMGMGECVITYLTPIMSAQLIPMLTFIIVALLTFATGSAWGIGAIAIEMFFTFAASLNASIVLTAAAVVSGCVLGTQLCLYADTTALTSKSAGIDSMDHIVSQMPYVAISAVLSLILYGVCGFLMS